MSKKKDRGWFVCEAWGELIARHYANDQQAAGALDIDPKLLAKLRTRTPIARSSLLKALRRYATRHDLGSAPAELVTDTRPR